MDESGERGAEVGSPRSVAGVPSRGRGAVGASILGALLIATYLAAAPGGLQTTTGEYLLNAAIVAMAFWFPAMRIGSLGDVIRQWKGLLVWVLAWVVVWDLATSGLIIERELFQDWWIVYPVGLLTLGGLLLLHGGVLTWVARRSGRGG